jgi:hypothetical protein
MILTVIKNSLLAILIILILHVILKNEVFEQTEKMKKYISSNNNGSMEESKKKVQFHDDIVPSKHSISKTINSKVDINTNNATDNNNDDKDCPNSLTCADFKLPDKKPDIDEMKELYDYVFEKHDTDQALETVFNNDDKVIHVDMTELDKHINDISETHTKEDNLLCSFEIIGIIENTEDDIGGVDMFSQNHLFSKVI